MVSAAGKHQILPLARRRTPLGLLLAASGLQPSVRLSGLDRLANMSPEDCQRGLFILAARLAEVLRSHIFVLPTRDVDFEESFGLGPLPTRLAAAVMCRFWAHQPIACQSLRFKACRLLLLVDFLSVIVQTITGLSVLALRKLGVLPAGSLTAASTKKFGGTSNKKNNDACERDTQD